MKEGRFVFVFLGIFLFILVVFFVVFWMLSSNGLDEGLGTLLWSALTMLVLIFGIIAISLFVKNRGNQKKPL